MLDPFEQLGPDTRLWLRLVEPATSPDECRLQLAINEPGDKVATVIADSGPVVPYFPLVFDLMEVQAVIDLWIYRRADAEIGRVNGLYLFAFVDLSRRGLRLGVPVENSPTHYV